MVLNNVTKFHKTQIKNIRLRQQNVSTCTDRGVNMPRPLSWWGGGIIMAVAAQDVACPYRVMARNSCRILN